MRRILLAVAAVGALAVGGVAQAGGPVQFVGWDHHHRGPEFCYRPQVRYYSPAVVYPQVVPVAPQVVAPYYYPGNSISLFGRNFGIRLGF